MNQLQYITGIHCITIKEEMIQRSQGMKKQPYFRGIPNHTDMMIKGNWPVAKSHYERNSFFVKKKSISSSRE